MEEQKPQSDKVEEIREAIESVHKTITENPDSIEIGTPSKGGAIKIYGNFDNEEAFKKKIDIAKEVREYANANISVNV